MAETQREKTADRRIKAYRSKVAPVRRPQDRLSITAGFLISAVTHVGETTAAGIVEQVTTLMADQAERLLRGEIA
jgi:hypothetical protein